MEGWFAQSIRTGASTAKTIILNNLKFKYYANIFTAEMIVDDTRKASQYQISKRSIVH